MRRLFKTTPAWMSLVLAGLLAGCSSGNNPPADGGSDGDGGQVECTTAVDCDDGNECTQDSCAASVCNNQPVADGTPCVDDSVFCNGAEICQGGVCSHPGDPCPGPDGDGDCAESCDEDSDTCLAADPEGAACDDGQWCTLSDACGAGVCSGTDRDCNDGDECTLDGCNEAEDACDHEIQPNPGAEGPAGDATCGNGIDDDCDGLTDDQDDDCTGLEWIQITGGTFQMGSDAGGSDELPIHSVTVPSFEMTKTEVTVDQYQACVDAGACTLPNDNTSNSYCNWGYSDRGAHPVNCVDWNQAVAFCSWAGGRLPSEAEWEYAARSGGQEITYPWGNDTATCQYAVMDEGGYGCGRDSTWASCGKTTGNTAQGLCDMAGNVCEWVQDWFHNDYTGAPADGSAWESSGSYRVYRGGSFGGFGSSYYFMRAADRSHDDQSTRKYFLGFRCSR